MLGGIAHDLNSPLISIKTDLSTLKYYLLQSNKVHSDSEEVQKDLINIIDTIERNALNMGKTVNSMRDQIRNTR